jgi:beta-lactam-binding protein with PASTA domain
MKCKQCGADLEDGVLFCRECGQKVEKQIAFCRECGAKVAEGSKFCSNCGEKVTVDTDIQYTLNEEDNEAYEEELEEEQEESFEVPLAPKNSLGYSGPPDNFFERALQFSKRKIKEFWNKRSLYGKVTTIAIGIFTLMCLVAILAGKTAAIVISLLQIAAAVVSILMHKGIIKLEQKKLWFKWLVLVAAILLLILNVYSYSWGRLSVDTNDDQHPVVTEPDDNEVVDDAKATETTAPICKTAILPFSDSEYVGQKREDIVNQLEQEGFINISVEPLAELEAEDLGRKGEVCKIEVDGSETFSKGTELDKNVAINITYYDAKKVAAPIAAEDCEKKDTNELVNMFQEAGFVNISVEIENDIDPEYSEETLRNEISIAYDSSFGTTDSIPIDAEVKITSHRPMEKYKIKINIDFIPNFFFDKYGVDVEIGYKDLCTLSHGEDNTYEIWLKPGQHTITFKKHSYRKPETKVEFAIRGETEITYQISCYEDSIHVEQTEFIYKGAVGETEAMTPASAQEFKYDNYKDVENSLKNAGFTNIKTSILYDIVWGWTSEGEVDSVSIDGNDEFLKGAIFDKNAEVIITYHMMAEDDPSRIKLTRDSSEYVGLDYTYVERELKELGFSNIVYDDEVSTNTCYHTGEVVEVRINYSEFEAGDSFAPDAEIKITRYKVDSAEVKPSITVTMNGEDFAGMHYTEADAKVRDMGFTNIVYRERITHDIDVVQETIDFVSIGSIHSFRVGEMFDNDAEVVIAYWKYEEFQSEYELAFVRRLSNYSLYYMFDTDTKKVVTFSTQDTYVDKGTYTGDFNTGVTITWDHGEWKEKFINKSGSSNATMIDGNGFDWEYVACDIVTAQKRLDELQ